jgi:hypothetical protein
VRPILFHKDAPDNPVPHARDCVRAEIPLDTREGLHTIIILDAEDSFDIVIQSPDSEREIVWCYAK